MVKHNGDTIIPERVMSWLKTSPRMLSYIVIGLLFITFAFPQTSEDDEDPVEVFWGEDEEYDDSYYEDDTLGYDDYYDDEDYEDEYYDDEYYEDDTTAYDDDYYYDDDTSGYYEDDELSEEDLADYAESKGFTVMGSVASPGYVNHPLMTYNSEVDYRFSVEFPLLLQVSRLKFRVGFEFGTFGFTNYLPAGGELKGNTYGGFLSFPAGPGQVRVGGGSDGNNLSYFAETTYGFALRNSLEIRAGVRSTTITNVANSKGVNLGNASWMDGVISLGISL